DDLLIRVNGGGGLDYSVDHGTTFSNKFGGVNQFVDPRTAISVNLGGGTNSLTIDASLAAVSNSFVSDTGGGTDTLIGPTGTNLWTITGANAGALDKKFTFSGVQNLTSNAAANDKFSLQSGGSLSGLISGPANGSGSLSIDGGTYSAESFNP